MKRKFCYRPLFHVRFVWRAVMVSAAVLFVGLAVLPCRAGYTQMTDSGNPVVDYFANWFPRVTQIQSEQPSWITPLVTVTPRLEQEFRYDQSWTTMNSSHYPQVDNYGTTKGLELIPFNPVEVIIGIPGYESEHMPRTGSTNEQGDAGLLYGFGERVGTLELIVATVETGWTVTQQARDDLDPLHEQIDALRQGREGDAKGAMLVFVPAGAQA